MKEANASLINYKEYEMLFDLAKKVAKTHPLLVLMVFYDINVSMRPEYPEQKSCARVVRDLQDKTRHYIAALESGKVLYPECKKTLLNFFNKKKDEAIKDLTGEIYGRQWRKFDFRKQFDYARKAIINRIGGNGFNLADLKNKSVIDIGCGSGRFACALASFGPKEVIAYDWGEDGLRVCKEMAGKIGIKNISFKKGSVLEIPYEDGHFDFCFSNGVFHHTEDMRMGLKEQYRIMKKGGAGWLYIYGDGGFFWYARKKMREAMKFIPESYAEMFLGLIDHNKNWFLPMDNWYVPIEIHTSTKKLENLLSRLGYRRYVRTRYGLPGDRTLEFLKKDKLAPVLFGEGDLRYLLYK